VKFWIPKIREISSTLDGETRGSAVGLFWKNLISLNLEISGGSESFARQKFKIPENSLKDG
jgi:hypothetical protein